MRLQRLWVRHRTYLIITIDCYFTGPSGAGKTSLLECICGKRESGLSGFIGVTVVKRDHLRMAFIPQHESFLVGLTVTETLRYASRLLQVNIENERKQVGLPIEMVDHDRRSRDMLAQFGMTDKANQPIHECSKSEQKRIAVFVELFGTPDLLVLDEPMTGLDSIDAFEICRLLHKLSRQHQLAVVMTIHQPAYRVFSLMDKIYMLTNHKGTCIYDGSPTDLNERFFVDYDGLEVPDATNPADYLLEVAAGRHCSTEVIDLMATRQREYFTSSQLIISDHSHKKLAYYLSNRSTSWHSLVSQTLILLSREMLNTSRKHCLIIMTLIMSGGQLGLIGGIIGKACSYDGCPPIVDDPSGYTYDDYRRDCIASGLVMMRVGECRSATTVYIFTLLLAVPTVFAIHTNKIIFNTVRGE